MLSFSLRIIALLLLSISLRVHAQASSEPALADGGYGHSAVLQMFLDCPTIYNTPHFQEEYGKMARTNIIRSLEMLNNSDNF
jgi:predicted metal-dependent HD superfamily phosphohydrolase